MKTVKQLLHTKGHVVHTIGPNESVFQAIKLMDRHKIGALVVVRREKVVGILSERDYARKVILKGRTSRATPVSKIMTKKVIFASPDETIDACMEVMTKKRIRHLPVLTGKKLTGIISIGDCVRATMEEKDFLIEQLGKYISGS